MELADTRRSGRRERKLVGVQISPPAHYGLQFSPKNHIVRINFAGVVQWQYTWLPIRIRGFDSLRPLTKSEKTMRPCSNKSAGVILQKGDKILLLERKNIPLGFAAPAGHVESDESFEEAARRELNEETGIDATTLLFLGEAKKGDNPCRRGGTWHYWKVYKAETDGEIHRNEESKQIGWFSKDDILQLAQKTERYLRGEIIEKDWEATPGLEPVWYEWFKELHII